MVQGVIFDMDGVLVDSEHFYQQRRETFLRRMDFPIPKEMNYIGSNEKAIWEKLVPDDALLRQEMMLGYRAYRKLHPVDYKKLVDPAVEPLFVELKRRGLRIGIASSSARSGILQMTKAAGITDLIDYIISGEECKEHKPNPEIYLRAMEGLGLSPQQTLAVEDSPTGITSANRAGLRVLALRPRHGEKMNQSEADVVLDRLEQVTEWLE